MKQTGLILVIAMLATALGCKDENQRDIDDRLIMEYVEDNMLDAQSTNSGLYIVIEEPGNGQHPNITHDVDIRYTGRLLNGTQFDSSNGDIVTFALNALILGWQEGIPYFGKGGKGQLIIPSHLGYGNRSQGIIPANSVLVFDIELVNFN